MFKIRELLHSDIYLLENLPPPEWSIDLPNFVLLHYGYPYFHAIVAESNNKIIGFGNGILNGKTGWVGNILVTPENRKQGIGYQLTNNIVEFLKDKGCTGQLLVATEMGKNIYTKIGFRVTSTYHRYDFNTESNIHVLNKQPEKIKDGDHASIKKLDLEITGEDRSQFIERFFATGLIYKCEESGKIKAVYLPDLGNGYIMAKDIETGLELMKLRANNGKKTVIVSPENIDAVEFLKKEGYEFHSILPRMTLGEEVNWKPSYIFNRGAGYCG